MWIQKKATPERPERSFHVKFFLSGQKNWRAPEEVVQNFLLMDGLGE